MSFESTRIVPEVEATRRVVIELPVSRALALSRALNEHMTWGKTEAADELCDLHEALGGDWRTAEEAAADRAAGR